MRHLVNIMVAKYIEENGERDKNFRVHDEHIVHRKKHALPLFPSDTDHARVAVHGARGAGDARRGGLRHLQYNYCDLFMIKARNICSYN